MCAALPRTELITKCSINQTGVQALSYPVCVHGCVCVYTMVSASHAFAIEKSGETETAC